jgi:hypothetical protein
VSGALVFLCSRLSRVTATPPIRGSGGEKRGLGVQNAVLSPCGLSFLFFFHFRNTYSSYSRSQLFWLSRSSHDVSLAHLLGIATLHPLLGLPRCRRYRRAPFRSCRWSIRIDHLRWTEIRVRPIRRASLSLELHYSLSPKCP